MVGLLHATILDGLSHGSKGWIITWIIRLDYHIFHEAGLSHGSYGWIITYLMRLDYHMDHMVGLSHGS